MAVLPGDRQSTFAVALGASQGDFRAQRYKPRIATMCCKACVCCLPADNLRPCNCVRGLQAN
jgi:hypothetical protein